MTLIHKATYRGLRPKLGESKFISIPAQLTEQQLETLIDLSIGVVIKEYLGREIVVAEVNAMDMIAVDYALQAANIPVMRDPPGTPQELTQAHLLQGSMVILKEGSWPKPLFWNGHDWTDNLDQAFQTKDPEALDEALISVSAADQEGQPALWTWVPVQLKEGPNAGKWVLQADVKFISKHPE